MSEQQNKGIEDTSPLTMEERFDTSVQNINMHLTSIFEGGELKEDSVIKEFLITADDKKTYKTKHYSLDAVIAVGYRVNSKRATDFRIWATNLSLTPSSSKEGNV